MPARKDTATSLLAYWTRRSAALSSTRESQAVLACQRPQSSQRNATAKEEKTGRRPQQQWHREQTPRRETGEAGGQGEATMEAVEAMEDAAHAREVAEAT